MRAGESGRVPVSRKRIEELCLAALTAAGASEEVAVLLTDAALFAEDRYAAAVGVSHLLDHVVALRDGRINGTAVPVIHRPAAGIVLADARDGIPHTAFNAVLPLLLETSRTQGVAAFTQRAAYSCGGLSWFTEQLADLGLCALAMATSPALVASAPGLPTTLGTNPMALSVPRPGHQPFTIDQASSAVAWVRVREAAQRAEPLEPGWALDREGRPTTDAAEGLAGALLPSGGHKGANLALMIELLASMAGGTWSLDAPPFEHGAEPPGLGMFVLAMEPRAFDPQFLDRLAAHLQRLAGLGVRLPGERRGGRLQSVLVLPSHLAELEGSATPG